MQISDYRVLVQREVDDTSSSASTVIDRAIRATYQEILGKVSQYLVGFNDSSMTVSAGTPTINISDSTTSTSSEVISPIIDVQYAKEGSNEYSKLKKISMVEYLDNHLNDSNGTPEFYLVDGANVIVAPPPSDNGTMRFRSGGYNPDLIGTQESVIPTRYEDAMVMGSCYRFFAYDDNPKSTEYFQWYQQALKNMVDELSADKITKPKLFGR